MMKRPTSPHSASDFRNAARGVPFHTYRNTGEGSQSVNISQGGEYANTGSGVFYNANNIYFGNSESNKSHEDVKFFKDLFTDPLTIPAIQREAYKNQTGGYVDGTCDWVLQTEEVITWLSSEASTQASSISSPNMLWLYGNPGQGKSAIAAYLIDHLSDLSRNDTGKCLTYFLCDSKYEARSNIVSIMRGLLGHLFQTYPQLLLKSIREDYRRLGNHLFNDFYHLWRLLMDVVTLQDDSHIFCIIDAIDECPGESQSILFRQIQEVFRQSRSQIRLSVLFLSRPYPEIRHQLGNFLNRDLASFPQLEQAIQKYIHHMIQKLSEAKNYPSSTKEEIMEILRSKAQGTFLWVGFACQDLQTLPSRTAVKHLEGLPKGLDSLSTKLLESLPKSPEEDMNGYERILGFVAAAKRPMTLLELSDACQLDLEKDEETRIQFMRERVGDLHFLVVISRAEHSNVQFSDPSANVSKSKFATTERAVLLHNSMRDIVYERSGAQYTNRERLHAAISYRCLDELIRHLSRSYFSTQTSSHFLAYAIKYWPYHAQMAQKEFTLQDSHVGFFATRSRVFRNWKKQWHKNRDETSLQQHNLDMSPLRVAARFGLWTVIDGVFSMQPYKGPIFRATHNDGYFDDSPPKHFNTTIHNGLSRFYKSPLADAVYSGSFETFWRLLNLGLPLTELTFENFRYLENDAKFIKLILRERIEELWWRKDLHLLMAKWLDAETLQVLVTDPKFELSNDLIRHAHINPKYASEVLKLFVDQVGENEVFSAANLKFLIQHGPSAAVARFYDIYRRPLPVDNEMIITAIKSKVAASEKAVILAVNRRDLLIEERTLLCALRRLRNDKMFWKTVLKIESAKIQLTPRIILEGLRVSKQNIKKAQILGFFLESQRPELQINEELIKAVIRNKEACLHDIELLFSHRGTDARIVRDILAVAAAEVDMITFLAIWESSGKVDFDPKVIVATTKNIRHGSEIMELVMSHVHIFFKIDDSIIQAAFLEESCKLMAFLVRKRGMAALSRLCEYKTAQVIEEIKTSPQERFLKILTQWVAVQCDATVKYRLDESDDATIMETCQAIRDWNHSNDDDDEVIELAEMAVWEGEE